MSAKGRVRNVLATSASSSSSKHARNYKGYYSYYFRFFLLAYLFCGDSTPTRR